MLVIELDICIEHIFNNAFSNMIVVPSQKQSSKNYENAIKCKTSSHIYYYIYTIESYKLILFV